MKIRNLIDLHKAIKYSTIISLGIICIISSIIIQIIFKQYKFSDELLTKQRIDYSISAYESSLAEHLAIIASSPLFLDYLRSGIITRHAHRADLLTLLRPLYSHAIIGMSIKNRSGSELFQDGKSSVSRLRIKICYLNDVLNPTLGKCNYFWDLYFNEYTLLEDVKNINSDIISCSNCKSNKIFEKSKLGSFIIDKEYTFAELFFTLKSHNESYFYILFGFIFLSLISLGLWNRRKIGSVIDKFVADPINIITKQLKANKPINLNDEALEEFQYLSDQLTLWKKEREIIQEQSKAIELSKLASEVAHDIRSPLTALDIAMDTVNTLPESERIQIRNAIQRIKDIANNLLTQHRNQLTRHEIDNKNTKPQLLVDLLFNIISEKRIQHINSPIELLDEFDNEVIGCFTLLPAIEFQRAFSNIINNAYEAITDKGTIKVTLSKRDKNFILKINDTGCGIPEKYITTLLQGGVSIGKKEGTGLGLASAAQFINSNGGKFMIKSTENVGTSVTIQLPIVTPPPWFSAKIFIKENTQIIILDDDSTIHEVWRKRFTDVNYDFSNIKFYTKASEVLNEFENNLIPPGIFFLLDYELINQEISGLELVKKLNIAQHALLVTSHYDEDPLQEQCLAIQLKMIPKSFAKLVSIVVLPNNPELIFIDDNTDLTAAWQNKAEQVGKKIITLNQIEDFQYLLQYIDKHTPIYVDLMLEGQENGKEFTQFLFEQGFDNLYISTGYNKEDVGHCDWVKAIVGKHPPF